jgi:hypothetical protein
VDRFGQTKKAVRALMLYGKDNPVDGEVLSVILRKAASIRRELGIAVPLPDEGTSLTQALLSRLLLRGRGAQLQLDFSETRPPHDHAVIELIWKDARERVTRSTKFAQGSSSPPTCGPSSPNLSTR